MADTGAVNFSGLASGLDTQTLIDDLVKVDSQPLERLNTKKSSVTTKRDTYTAMNTSLLELKTKVSDLVSSTQFGAFSASSSDEEALSVSASTSANEGNYTVSVLSLAKAKALSGQSYTRTDTALGLSGEIRINGETLKVRASDTLNDVRLAINALDAGVSASVLKVNTGDNRLILTAQNQGSEGFLVANIGSTDILGSLGFTDGTTVVRLVEDGAVMSGALESANATVGGLLGMTSSVSGTVGIKNKSVAIDMATDSLAAIRDKINDLGIPSVQASIVSSTADGLTTYRLAISGTQAFTDDNSILETLGILSGGTSGTNAKFQTGVISDKISDAAIGNEKLVLLGAQESETISITGKTANGVSVAKTLVVDGQTRINDVLQAAEEAFGGDIEAFIQDGRIVIKAVETGESRLSFNISTGNENDGTLDFGTVSTVTKGRDRLLTDGVDARVLVNNVEIVRDTNTITDAVDGLTLLLKDADAETELMVTVSRNTETARTKIEAMVSAYNGLIDYVNENSQYDEETKEAGPLLGDQTTQQILRRLRTSLQSSVFGDDYAYNQLAQIGIQTTAEGKLTISTSTLNDALNTDSDSVISLFAATRESSDNDINFVYNTTKTKAGSYAVSITQAAEQAEVTSRQFESGRIGENGSMNVTDSYGNTMDVAYTEDMTTSDLANAINAEAARTENRVVKLNTALNANGTGAASDQSTLLSTIAGKEFVDGDTMTISGFTRGGKEYRREISLSGDTKTVGDLMGVIETLNNSAVNATIDADGRIRIEDKTQGTSKFSIAITSTVAGLDLGSYETIQQGRYAVNVSAESDGSGVSIQHAAYGSSSTFTVSGADVLGIASATYAGVDVAGTINGVEGTGSGRNLRASDSDSNSRGILVQVNITPEDLATEGSSQGTITLISGVADRLFSELSAMTDTVSGTVKTSLDQYKRTLESVNKQIDDMNKRIENRRQQYIRKFTALETTLARLQFTQQQLNATLGSLSTTSLFSSMS